MNLLKPLTQPRDQTTLVVSPPFTYHDKVLQLDITTSMHFGFFFNLKPGEESAPFTLPELSVTKNFPDYLKVKQILNACANLAEAIDVQLLGLLHRAYPNRREELGMMDFYQKRGVFSDLVHKTNALKRLPDFDNKVKRKTITKTLADFVVYRNYYTHGVLILKYGTKQYYIKCIEKSTGAEITFGIDRAILTSYLDTGAEFQRLMLIVLQSLP